MNWNTVENDLINISFGLLIIVLITYWSSIIFNKISNLYKISKKLTIFINILLSTALSIRWIINQYFPLSNLFESLIFLTWCLTFIQILLEKQNKNKLIAAINIPISLFTLSFASICLPAEMKTAIPLVPALKSNWLVMHVTVMMISYATLMIGSVLSILFLVISNGKKIDIQGNSYSSGKKIILKYKSNNFENILNKQKNYTNNITKKSYRVNLLQGIDNLSYRIIGLGFPLLTIGIISGAVWANEAWGNYWSWDPKETWALITWIVFAIYLHSRLNQEWKGKKPAIIASLGFVLIWVCYLGVNFLGKGLHSYGWLFL
uniref:Cytochrome c biogenesis protein CcsA n=1 Tax=Bostrychia simpliciuscula TaxID=324754 RepID=A0A1Z1M880_9FLOR|nr:cytochrome c biogenesis protein ccs1 [Bostrychia simpliciuscula]ARW62041.1 cytochrome c biogenesis protein ccs1 [Bostrychia simpliciuscula]